MKFEPVQYDPRTDVIQPSNQPYESDEVDYVDDAYAVVADARPVVGWSPYTHLLRIEYQPLGNAPKMVFYELATGDPRA